MSVPPRNGFTLLESVAAVALCAVILATVFKSLDIASQQRRSGRAQVQLDAELIGLLRVIETAIRDTQNETSPPDFDSAWSPRMREQSPANIASPNRPSTALLGTAWEASPWLVGSKHSLLLLSPDSHRADDNALRGFRTATLLSGESAGGGELPPRWQQVLRDPLASNDARSHLMLRTLRAAPSIDARNPTGRTSSPPDSLPWEIVKRVSMSKVISGLRFRYSDGETWHDAWPTTSRLPLRAVEVTLIGANGGIERTHRLLIACESAGGPP